MSFAILSMVRPVGGEYGVDWLNLQSCMSRIQDTSQKQDCHGGVHCKIQKCRAPGEENDWKGCKKRAEIRIKG